MPIFKVKEIRSREGELHFIRYRIVSTPWFSIYIHRIFKEDQDTHLHDHPWDFWSIILSGGYTYKAKDESVSSIGDVYIGHRGRGHMLSIPAKNHYHKILQLDNGKPVTTFVISGRRKHFWGYDVDGTFVDHKTYRKRKNNNTNAGK